jgi:hypothetical protein
MNPIKRTPIYTQTTKSLPPLKFKDKYDKDYGKGAWNRENLKRNKINKNGKV